MKLVAAAVPTPEDTEPQQLSDLIYSTRAWRAEVQSIRLQEMPEPGAKSVVWLIRATNTQSRIQKVDVDVQLLDAQHERLTATSKPLILLAHSEDADYKVKMKLPAGVWEKCETVRVEVRFSTL